VLRFEQMKASGRQPGAPARLRRGPLGERYSKSAELARQREYARIAAMTPLERAVLALQLGERDRLVRQKSRRGTRSKR
jgi:hypothetical protein